MSKQEQNDTSNSTNSEQQERSGILYTANEGHSLKSNSEKQKVHNISGTPFQLVKEQKETGDVVFIGLGRFRLTPDYDYDEITITGETPDDVGNKILERNTWDIILKLLGIIIPQEVTAQIAYRDEYFKSGKYKTDILGPEIQFPKEQ